MGGVWIWTYSKIEIGMEDSQKKMQKFNSTYI